MRYYKYSAGEFKNVFYTIVFLINIILKNNCQILLKIIIIIKHNLCICMKRGLRIYFSTGESGGEKQKVTKTKTLNVYFKIIHPIISKVSRQAPPPS